ncbi:hypothetical protein SDC9_143102 [bioreactor metagenome]|uniref:Uncharacterized protein n=1 Tax=bioreactor metagenome TaxID=1076179 RepID=A0A645E2Z8_9ZZZZ
MVVHLQDNVAAPAAVTAVRAASGHIFFPVKGDCSVAPRARFHRNAGGI